MISDVILAMRARLVASGVSAPLLYGKRHLRQTGNGAPFTAQDGGGRIVLIGTKDKWKVGGTQGFNENPAHILTRGCGAEIHIWAVGDPTSTDHDVDAVAKVEYMLHIFLRELHQITIGHFQVVDSDWNTDVPEQKTDQRLWGQEYVVNVVIDVPLTKRKRAPLPNGTEIKPTFFVGPNTPEQVP